MATITLETSGLTRQQSETVVSVLKNHKVN